MTSSRAEGFALDSEVTPRKTAACRLATRLVSILDEQPYGTRSDLARRLGVTPVAITQALHPEKYDTSLTVLIGIAEALGYEAEITYKVDARVKVRKMR